MARQLLLPTKLHLLSLCRTFATKSPQSFGPLEGIRVLDLTRILAGPFCTMLLGDLGAEIIKIERVGTGDDTRQWGPPFAGDDSCYFLSVNRNKQSVAVNFKSKKGLDIVKRLADKSDVLVENFKPGNLDKLGLGYKDLSKTNPGLIYCTISGYGSTGPLAHRPCYDVIAAAMAGLLSVTGPSDGEPCKPGVAMTDLSTALYAHGAIMAGLIHRSKNGGKGQKIDCDLLGTQMSLMTNLSSSFLNGGVEPQRRGTAHENLVPYQAYQTKGGGYMVICAGNELQFEDFCKHVGLKPDEQYASNALRVKNRKQLEADINRIMTEKSNDEWSQVFQDSVFVWGPACTISESFKTPQALHKGMVQEVDHAVAGKLRLLGPAVTYSSAENKIRSAPPVVGEHTMNVLNNILGYSEEDVKSLSKSGAIQLTKLSKKRA